MARKTEAEFVNEGLTDEEIETLGTGDTGGDSQEGTVQTGTDGQGDAPDAAQQPAAQPEPKMVDVRALQEARAAQRAAEQRLAAFEQDRIRIDERLKVINEALAGNQKPQTPVPSFEEDPIGNFNHRFEEQQKLINSLNEQLAQRNTFEEQARGRQAVIDRAGMAIDMSRASNPDVDEALNFAANALKTKISTDLMNQGYSGPQFAAAFKQVYDNSIANLANGCPTDPDQAAEHVRMHARFWGWRDPRLMPQQVQQQATQAQAAAQPTQVAQQPQPVTPQQRAEQQQRHMSLSGTQGGQAPLQLSAKALAEMSDEQFTALMKTADGRKKVDSILAGN
jgi:hypothetical protein